MSRTALIAITGALGYYLGSRKYHEKLKIIKPAHAEPQKFLVPQDSHLAEAAKYGLPTASGSLRIMNNFIIAYDQRNRVPSWVFEHLTPRSFESHSQDESEKVSRSKCEFYEDSTIHPFFRSENSDYKGSGYDRGHLAAAGNHRSSQQDIAETFILSNMAPQVGKGFNRDMWNNLEKYVRKLARKYPHTYVCTGPLYLPRREEDGKAYVKYEVIGKNNVAVPTHFFKVVVCETENHELHLETYVLPNAPIDDNVPLKSFLVPIESVERAAGFLIFSQIPKTSFRCINRICSAPLLS